MWVSSFSSLPPRHLGRNSYNNKRLMAPEPGDQLHFSGKKRARAVDEDNTEAPIFKAARLDNADDISRLLQEGLSIEQLNAEEMTPLMVAANAGNLAAVKVMLPHVNNLQQQDAIGKTALHHAVEQDHLLVVSALVNQNANRGIEDHEYHTPITQAAKLGNVEALRILCKGNADLNPFHAHSKAKMPLKTAIQHNQPAAAAFLLAEGAHPDGPVGRYTSDTSRPIKTPLMVAAAQNHTELIDLLVEHGAELDLRSKKGLTALTYALGNDRWESVQKLLERHANVTSDMEELQEVMAKAAENEELSKVCFLLQHGVALDQAPRYNQQVYPFALQVAALKNDVESARILLKYGVSTEVEIGLKPALILAAERGYARMVGLLLAYGVDIDIQSEAEASNEQGETALHAAVKNNHPKLIEFLLNKGADLEMADGEGRTAFTHAIESGHNDLAKILHAKYHAQLEWEFESEEVETPPLLAAAENGNEEILDYMIQAGVNVDSTSSERLTPLMVAKTVRIAQKLINAGARVNKRDLAGRTPFMHQAFAGDTEVMQFLLLHGASINEVDENEKNSLMLAAQSNKPSAVQLMLKRHAVLNKTDRKGNTALMHAMKGHPESEDNGEKNRVEILKALIDKGENIHAFNQKEQNALMMAAARLQPDSVALLLQHGAKPQPKTEGAVSALTWAARAASGKAELSLETLKVLRLLIQADPHDAAENKALSYLVRKYAQKASPQEFSDLKAPIITQRKWESAYKALKNLLETGINPSLGLPEIAKALNYAARHNESDKVEFLLKKGLAPDSIHRSIRTPLMSAAKFGHTQTADILLEYGADPNSSNQNKETPFKLAAKQGCLNTMLRLLQAGADPAPHILPRCMNYSLAQNY